MIVFRLLVVIAFASVCSGRAIGDDGELKAVIVLFRHGDRSPLSSWPNDEYFGDASLWPDGYGQLNNFGKQRHYALGQWFRNRYDGFLPARYNRSDIYVRSTDVDRTLMSAASNLAGLYPPSGDQVWNENIPWQAIPIHTVPVDSDEILTDAIPCPKHDRLMEELLNSTEFQQFIQDHAEIYQSLAQATGYSLDEVSDKLYTIFSTITIYREFNLTLPAWTDDYWPDIKALAAFVFQADTYTQDLARLRTGPFMNYLIDHLNAIKANTKPKFLMLSAHDSTIADRTNAMGVYADAAPEFASTVIWEVKSRTANDDNLYVNMYYKNSTHFSPLTVPGCDFDCDIDDYAEVLKPITVSDDQWIQECYGN